MADAESARQEDRGPGPEIMRLLELALRPVDPPADFMTQLEGKLANIEAAALEALEEVVDWELATMRDPRNWVRPVAAVAVGTAAGTALVVLGLRTRRRRTSAPAKHRRTGRQGRKQCGLLRARRDSLGATSPYVSFDAVELQPLDDRLIGFSVDLPVAGAQETFQSIPLLGWALGRQRAGHAHRGARPARRVLHAAREPGAGGPRRGL